MDYTQYPYVFRYGPRTRKILGTYKPLFLQFFQDPRFGQEQYHLSKKKKDRRQLQEKKVLSRPPLRTRTGSPE
jgi:hypothetical protein